MPVFRSDLEARKRAVYAAFFAIGAAGALFSFALNLLRTTPDPAVARIQLATAVVLAVSVFVVGWRRVPLAQVERVAFGFGAIVVVGSIAWSLYGADPVTLRAGGRPVDAALAAVGLRVRVRRLPGEDGDAGRRGADGRRGRAGACRTTSRRRAAA